MAESYRGLTIRIGGDTTKLSQALKTANQAVAGTQGELRKLSQALRFDPSSMKATQLQMGALAEQASNVATRVLTLNQSLQQVGDFIPSGSGQSIRELAEGWKNVQMNVSVTRKEFAALDESLATMYTDLSRRHAEAAGTLKPVVDEYQKLKKTYEEYKQEIEANKDDESYVKELEKELVVTRTEMTRLKDEWGSLVETMSNGGIVFSNKNDNTDLASIASALEGIVKAEIMTSEEADEMYNKIEKLKGIFNTASDELSKFKKVAKFTDLEAETAKAEAQMESLVAQLIRANQVSDTAQGMGVLSQRLSDVDASGKKAVESLKSIVTTMKNGGSTKELRAEAVKQYTEAVAAARAKVATLQEQIAQYSDDEVIKLSQSTKSLLNETLEATKGFGDATKSASVYQAMLNKVNERLGELRSGHDDFEELDEYKDLTAQAGLLSDALDRASEHTQAARKEMQKYVEAGELSDKTRELTNQESVLRAIRNLNLDPSTASVKELEKALKLLSETDATPHIDNAAFMQAVNMVGQAARRIGSEVVESAREIDSAYRDMRKTVNATEREFEALKDQAIKFSQAHVTSSDTMLEMQALGGQLGILSDDLAQFGEISSNLDIATNISAEDIALQLGQVANVLDLDIDGMQGFADALVRLGNNMPAQESAIMNVAQRFGAVATTANFSGSEILAWSAAIASTGQRSEMAATAIGNTVSGIEQAVAQGGNSIKAFATIAGKSAEEFTQIWKDSPTKALQLFIEGLHTMTESKESAVAALEDMGITGVRQQQTLLGLSQTVDNLDDALAMSGNAWNQVSDQWGQAGDASIEAQKKSEGFSGALAILQNNVQNLTASLGDGLVEPMKIAASVLGTVTDALNAMPAPVKTILTSVGALAIVIPGLSSVLNILGGGLGSLIGNIAQAGGNIGTLVAKLTGLESVMTSAAAAGVDLSVVMSSGVAIPIAAAITAIGVLIAGYEDWRRQSEELNSATEGLTSAMDAAQSAYDSYANGADTASTSVIQLRDHVREAIQAQAELADKMTDAWGEVGKSEAAVDGMVKTIEELSSKTSLSAKEQTRLVTAVDAFNTMTGQSIAVTDEMHGTLSSSIEGIKRYAKAWKDSTESKTALEDYNEAVALQVENERLLDEALKAKEKAMKDVNNNYSDMYNGASSANVALATSSAEVEKLNALIEDNKKAQDNALEKMSSSESAIAAVETTLASVGDSLANYGKLSDDQLRKVVKAYNDTSNSSISALERIRNALNEIKKDAQNSADEFGAATSDAMDAASREANKRRAQEQKDQYDAENRERQHHYDDVYRAKQRELDGLYKVEQRGRDQIYKEQQRAYDAEYKAQQKAYDAEYKAAQKAFDAEYKQIQKALDAEYDEWKKYYDNIYNQQKKELDAIYDQQKKAYDDAYELQKKEIDKSYDQRKKALDKEYSDLKDSLDKVYKERKKQYDAQLKLLKDKQGDEVDAFKKATDAKLKEMEREYKARLKLLEEQYGVKTDDIDDEIDRLNAQTEAEKKAIEERKQNEKIAELKSNVEKAKSRRKRADAEKALNDYLQEVEQKRNEDARKSEIERLNEKKDALKDELEARKEQLKAEYDAEVEAYKLSREQQLEALQAANEAEYEKRQEQFELLLEQLKKQQEAQLESVKETQQAELDSVKEANEQKLATIKEGYDTQLESLKENHQMQLDATKEANDQQLEMIKENHQAQLEAVKENQQTQLEALKESQTTALEDLKQSQSDQLETLKQGQQDELEVIKQGHQDELAELKQNQQDELAAIKDEQAQKLEEIKAGNSANEQENKRSADENVKTRSKEEEDEKRIHFKMVHNARQTTEDIKSTRSDLNGFEQQMHIEMVNRSRKTAEETSNAAKEGARQSEETVKVAKNAILGTMEETVREAIQRGRETGEGFGSGLEGGGQTAEQQAMAIGEKVLFQIAGVSEQMRISGTDAAINFGNGLSAEEAISAVTSGALAVAGAAFSILHFSVPDKGPLRHQDQWGGHFVDNLVKGMRSRERDLLRQTERMANIMEDGFNPDLSVQAAVEATKSLRSIGTPVSMAGGANGASMFSPNIEINISGVSVRNDSDIDKLANTISQRMAAATARELAGRLG